MIISFDHVSHRYSRSDALTLNDLSLKWDTARLTGVCGKTGSGKSTFIQHLNGILKPTAGHIQIDDIPLHASKQTIQRIRQRIGMTFQFPERQLFGHTVWEELTYTLDYHAIPGKEQHQRIAEVCEWLEFDLEGNRKRSPFTLSRSEQRKLGIAVALCLQPELLVLDEPTAGMDRQQAYRLLDTLHRLHRQQICQVLLVAHDLELLLEYAEYLLILAGGRLAWEGSPPSLLRSPESLRPAGIPLPQVYADLLRLEEHGAGLLAETLSIRTILTKIAQPA